MRDQKERTRLVEQARQHLEAAGRPRLVMLAMLSVTLGVGFLSSVAMLHLGVARMPIRYPLAVGVAYATFLGMLRMWLERQVTAAMIRDDPEGLLVPGVAAFGAAAIGKDLAGNLAPRDQGRRKGSGGGGFGHFGNIGGGGDGLSALVILVLIAGLCTLIVSVYLVVTSPLLLAELFVDGVLLGAMSRAITPESAPHWSRSAVRRTWLSAIVMAVVFGLVGFGIERIAPGSHTLAEAWAAEKSHR
ncbi:hypothetical protein [Singulisphaera sp. PoT]|uniref:hypothetical protein n=1 Tax=Singulisphaera sp. PoT TaxID=3411797 RepID=UPI003BF5749D